MKIYPAILSDSLQVVADQLAAAQEFAEIEGVQIDVIDGAFADNLTVTPSDLPELSFGELQCDFHLMTEEPLDYVFELSNFKDTLPVRAVLGQIERMTSQVHFLEEVQKQGWYPGLSLDIFTPIEEIDPESWQYLQVVQLMGIEAGAQGRQFNPLVLDKILELRTRLQVEDASVEIIVDGGVNEKTIAPLVRAGAQSVVVGSAVWGAADPHQALADLRHKIQKKE